MERRRLESEAPTGHGRSRNRAGRTVAPGGGRWSRHRRWPRPSASSSVLEPEGFHVEPGGDSRPRPSVLALVGAQLTLHRPERDLADHHPGVHANRGRRGDLQRPGEDGAAVSEWRGELDPQPEGRDRAAGVEGRRVVGAAHRLHGRAQVELPRLEHEALGSDLVVHGLHRLKAVYDLLLVADDVLGEPEAVAVGLQSRGVEVVDLHVAGQHLVLDLAPGENQSQLPTSRRTALRNEARSEQFSITASAWIWSRPSVERSETVTSPRAARRAWRTGAGACTRTT